MKPKLKRVIEEIIRDTIVNKLIGEGQPVGGVKNDHDFDAGRYGVMKAVNVAENHNLIGIPTLHADVVKVRDGSGVDSGKIGTIVKTKYKQTNGGMIPDESGAYKPQPVGWISVKFDDGHVSSFPRNRLERASRINPKLKEKVGFDGKYVDDMESGTAVKKLHNLDESNKQKFVYPENFKQVKNYIRIVRRPETNEFIVTWYENGRLNEDKSYFTDDIKDAWDTFNHMKPQVDKSNSGMNENEEEKILGKFVNRGEIQLEGGLDYDTAYKIAKYHWDIFGQSGKDEHGVWNFQTRGNRWCCAVGKLNGQPAMLSVTTTPGRLQLLVGRELIPERKENLNELGGPPTQMGYVIGALRMYKGDRQKAMEWLGKMAEKAWRNRARQLSGDYSRAMLFLEKNPDYKVNEMTSSGAAGAYNTPFAFSKNKMGSSRAIKSAKKYGTVVKSISEKYE